MNHKTKFWCGFGALMVFYVITIFFEHTALGRAIDRVVDGATVIFGWLVIAGLVASVGYIVYEAIFIREESWFR